MKRHIEGMLWAVSFLSLTVAAMMTGKSYLMVLAVIWIVSSMIVIPLHFYKAWRRWREVPNRRGYAAWVGFETIATMALIGLFVYSVFSR
jgi:hypothetical protein